jgi:hypothetical protein
LNAKIGEAIGIDSPMELLKISVADFTDEELVDHFSRFTKDDGTVNEAKALEALGKRPDDKSTSRRYWKAMYSLSEAGLKDSELRVLKKKIKNLKEELNQDRGVRDYIKSLMLDISGATIDTTPKWVDKAEGSRKMIPVFFDTDTHYGEVVSKEALNGVNIYNADEAVRRLNYGVDKFIEICTKKKPYYQYDGVVYALGGDRVTGSLHDLAETNDRTPIQQVVELTEITAQQIMKLKKTFGRVFVPSVTGNHSRLAHRRTKTKGRTNDSLETLVFAKLSMMFQNDKDVQIVYNNSDIVYFSLNGTKFKLQHGDEYRGGTGIGGVVVPIKRGLAKEHQSASATGQHFDVKMIGHFHFHHAEEGLIIGNSPKGYDEFTKSMNIPYSDAGFTTFFVNSHGDRVDVTNLKIKMEESTREQGVKIW